VAIDEAWFASDDAATTDARLAQVFPDPVRGSFRVANTADWAFRPVPPLPSPVGFGIRVKSLAKTRALLAANGVAVTERDGLWVGPADACGSAIRFFERTSK